MQEDLASFGISDFIMQEQEPCMDCGSTDRTETHREGNRMIVRCRSCEIEKAIEDRQRKKLPKQRRKISAVEIKINEIPPINKKDETVRSGIRKLCCTARK